MKEEWLFPGAVVPVDVETTAALVAEIKRLIDVVGGMALMQPAQRTWVGLTLADKEEYLAQDFGGNRLDAMDWAARKLKEKNT